MPGLYKDEGIVLKTIKLGEADRIVTMFTRQNGKVRAVAKGIRKTKSRFGGRLEPYTRVQLVVYRGRNLDTITSADIITSFRELRAGYREVTAAAALVELVEKISPEREPSFQTYRLLLGGLQALAAGKGEGVVPAFLVKLLSLSGFHPCLQVCAGCGASDLAGFSPALGGAVCLSCWEEDDHAMRLEEEQLGLLVRLLALDFGQNVDKDAFVLVIQALRRYAEYHLERPLRSLQLLEAS